MNLSLWWVWRPQAYAEWKKSLAFLEWSMKRGGQWEWSLFFFLFSLGGYGRGHPPMLRKEKRAERKNKRNVFSSLSSWMEWSEAKRNPKKKWSQRSETKQWVDWMKRRKGWVVEFDWINQMKAAHPAWTEWKERGPKAPNAPRQAKNNSKSMLARFCRIDWIVCGGVWLGLFSCGGLWAQRAIMLRKERNQPNQATKPFILFYLLLWNGIICLFWSNGNGAKSKQMKEWKHFFHKSQQMEQKKINCEMNSWMEQLISWLASFVDCCGLWAQSAPLPRSHSLHQKLSLLIPLNLLAFSLICPSEDKPAQRD